MAEVSVARRRSVSVVARSSDGSGILKLSLRGEAVAMPEEPPSVSHSSRMPSRCHAAAFVGDAETKNCCQALVRWMAKVRSKGTGRGPSPSLGPGELVVAGGQSAAKAGTRRQAEVRGRLSG